jgi:rhodanese-related sulfurtransferase
MSEGGLSLTWARRAAAGLRPSPVRIDAATARALLAGGALLVDVRRYDDPEGPPAGAVRIPPDEVPARLGELRRDVPIVLACT